MRVLLILLLAGCATASTIDMTRPPPADWPTLKVVIQTATTQEFARYCGTDTEQTHFVSCAAVSFPKSTCWILVRPGETLTSYWEDHERKHCAGYDHPGQSGMRDAWASYSKSLKK